MKPNIVFTALLDVLRSSKAKKLFLCILLGTFSLRTAFGGAENKLIIHEWGTFTSLQGGDGAVIPWRLRNVVALPAFVYNWKTPGFDRRCTSPYSFTGKGEVMAMQRMETPVVYFYSDKEETADLTVRFPQGLITEWYPQAQEIGPSVPKSQTSTTKPVRESLIRWENFHIVLGAHEVAVPHDSHGSQYFAARDTDSAVLQVHSRNTTDAITEREKFLFYRGVGNFGTPLKVSMSASGEVHLSNTSKETLEHLFVLQVHDGTIRFVKVSRLAVGEEKSVAIESGVPWKALKEGLQEVGVEMADALISQKLFAREAKAMVNTWKDSWFEEPGVRVLYVLPRAWTDQTLPFEMKPSPNELVRVMVGRAEIVPPSLENRLSTELSRASFENADASGNLEKIVKELGRFAEPVLLRSLKNAQLKPDQQRRWYSLLASVLNPSTNTP